MEAAPVGGFTGLGRSPFRMIRSFFCFGSGTGTEDSECKDRRAIIQRIFIGGLHERSQIHDADSVADMLNHAEIMGDEQISQAVFLLKILRGSAPAIGWKHPARTQARRQQLDSDARTALWQCRSAPLTAAELMSKTLGMETV